MKYIAILDSDDEFTKEVINDLKNTLFLGDDPSYAFDILSIEKQEQGEWIEVKSTEYEGLFSVIDMKCNCCNKYASLVLPHGTICTYDYCPNCKADMRGRENETN